MLPKSTPQMSENVKPCLTMAYAVAGTHRAVRISSNTKTAFTAGAGGAGRILAVGAEIPKGCTALMSIHK